MNGSRGTRIGWNPGRTVIPSMILSKNAGIIMTIRRSPRRRNSSLRHKIEKKTIIINERKKELAGLS